MKIVVLELAVRSDDDVEQLRQELYQDALSMYEEAWDDVIVLQVKDRDPSEEDLSILEERLGNN